MVGAIALAFFLSAKFSFFLVQLGADAKASPLFPPAGISLAALLLLGQQTWVGVALGAVLFGKSLTGVTWITALGAAFGSTLAALMGEFLLRQVGFRPSLCRIRDVLALVTLAGMLSTSVNATISTLNGYWAGLIPEWELLSHWCITWLGDAVGVLVVTPVLLTWFSRPPSLKQPIQALVAAWEQSPVFRRRLAEMGLWLSLLVLCGWIVLNAQPHLPPDHPLAIARYLLHYLPFLFIVWAALRLGQRGTVLSSLVLSTIAIWGTVQNRGQFISQMVGDPQQTVFHLQAFVGVTTIMALILAAAIAEQQQAENLLRKQEASLANAQRIAQIGNWDLDCVEGSASALSWSDELYRILGFVPRSIPPDQEAFLQAVHSDDRKRVRQCLNAAMFQQQSYSLVYRIVRPDRSERIVSEQVSINGMSVTGTVQDITEERRIAQRDRLLSETTLRIRQSLDLSQIFETTVEEVRQFFRADRVYISQFDQEGYSHVVAESVDPAWRSILEAEFPMPLLHEVQAIFGSDRVRINHNSQLVEKNAFLTLYYEEYQIKASLAIPIMQEGQMFGVLHINQCSAPRQWQPFEIQLLEQLATQVEIAIQQGCLYQQIQTCANTLEQQVQERTLQLEQNMEQLQSLNEIKDTLLHAVTHDLQTPLLGTLMFLQKLQARSENDIVLSRSHLNLIIQSFERQLSLIRSLSEGHSLESQPLKLNLETLQFSDLVQSTLQELEPILTTNQVKLNNLVPSNLPLLKADFTQLKRVLENIINNACQHNSPGLTLTIATEIITSNADLADETQNSKLKTQNSKLKTLQCTLSDNGIGMTSEQCAQIFRKPYLRGSHNRYLTGLGLGLFICHQVIKAHHGKIGVQSSPNEGTTIWFTLPLIEA
jgi:signal transduction histidine kinase/integral membrane sensor domain MASE1